MARTYQVRGPDGRVYELNLDNETVRTPEGSMLQTRELSSSDVHLQSAMQNFATGYGRNAEFAIADIICPPILVDKPTDKFHTWSSGDLINDVTDDIVGDDGTINTVSPSKSNSTYTTVGHGLASFVSYRVQAAADAPINPEVAALRRIMNAMCMRREVRVAAVMLDGTTAFASNKTTLGSTYKWNGGESSDPVKDIMTACETALKPITHIGMSLRTWNTMLRNPNTLKYGLASVGERVLASSPDEVAARFGLVGVKFVIGRMQRKSPTAGTTGFIWGNDVICAHVPSGASNDEEEVPTARTFRWNSNGSSGFEIRQWEEPRRGSRGGRMIAVVTDEVSQVVAADTGHLIVGAYQ